MICYFCSIDVKLTFTPYVSSEIIACPSCSRTVIRASGYVCEDTRFDIYGGNSFTPHLWKEEIDEVKQMRRCPQCGGTHQ